MRRPNKDEIRGKIDEAAGTVKENIGRARGDVDLENEGADPAARWKAAWARPAARSAKASTTSGTS